MILVSAIVPTYNRSYIVGEAIESILAQTYPNVETVVVDDGSTDDTAATLRRYGSKIRVISQSNAGPAAARNTGIRESRGEILTFLDSDDVWLPNFLERQVAALENAGPSVACSLCNGWLEFADGRRETAFNYARLCPDSEEGLWLNPDEIFASRFLQFNQMVAVRRSALDKVGMFDPQLRYLEDWDLALRLALDRPWCFVRDPLVRWRQRKIDSLSQVKRQDEVLLRRTVVAIRNRAITTLSENDGSASFRALMNHGLRHNNRELSAAILCSHGTLSRAAGHILKGWETVREKAYCRSKLYPKMQVIPFAVEPTLAASCT